MGGVQVPAMETRTQTVQRPKTVMEEREITVQEPRTVMETKQVQVRTATNAPERAHTQAILKKTQVLSTEMQVALV